MYSRRRKGLVKTVVDTTQLTVPFASVMGLDEYLSISLIPPYFDGYFLTK